jgi:hypothetical protein
MIEAGSMQNGEGHPEVGISVFHLERGPFY